MLPALFITLGGGVLFYWAQRSPSITPRLIEGLTSESTVDFLDLPTPPLQAPAVEPKLALAVGLLGVTTVGQWLFPFWRLVSLPGLLYFDLHFIRTAYHAWQAEQRLSIATNDALLMTGLLATRQFAATSLFATLFFTSSTLQKRAEQKLTCYLAATTPAAITAAAEQADVPLSAPRMLDTVTLDQHGRLPDQPAWQTTIDQGALPLLTLGAFSIPWLGLRRSLAVLLTNFGYDYRLTAPLSTLTYLKAANAQGIWLRQVHVLDQLQTVDVVVLDIAAEECWLDALHADPMRDANGAARTVIGLRSRVDQHDPATLLNQLRTHGQRVAYVSDRSATADLAAAADLLIAINGSAGAAPPWAHVVLAGEQPDQLQALFRLALSLQANRRQGFYLALAPSLLNLGGIYLGHFSVIAALLVDYGAVLAGVVNAMLPIQTGPRHR